MMFRELRGMEIGEVKTLGKISDNIEQLITRAPNGWIWTTHQTGTGQISSVFVPEKRFRKRVEEGQSV
jgi:hypothetical protein